MVKKQFFLGFQCRFQMPREIEASDVSWATDAAGAHGVQDTIKIPTIDNSAPNQIIRKSL